MAILDTLHLVPAILRTLYTVFSWVTETKKGVHQINVGDWEHWYSSVCIAYVHHEQYKVEHRYPVLIIVITMAPLPDIHGFKWVQLSPNQCVTRCH